MHFSLITPTTKRTMKVTWIEIESYKGNLVIQDGYEPSLIIIKPESRVMVGFSNGTTESFAPISGVLQVNRDATQLLVDV